jgi:hypothetical protein
MAYLALAIKDRHVEPRIIGAVSGRPEDRADPAVG